MNAKSDVDSNATLNAFREVVRSRRSVRRFTDEPVPEHVLDDCLELAMLALRAHGYDSCPMEGFDECRVRRLLKLPRKGLVTMVLAAGKRSDKGVYNRQYRFERDTLIHYL
ncbi:MULTISPECIES: nitroreductase family protein [unclassified Marinobacter]|jgi:nitroreductase|uniref:nitroreductase family protein n=1 Tax=Marinobacter TaxID=2742 RepID=UPI000948B79A|nr:MULTISPECIES: nitroreductase family protein [unclassified Marinobacter]MAB52277.1 hypothetical protein [Marinobacter sp.]OLF82851.1 hypothetical protein AWH63_07585 [Marinobacter sp. C18]|tara:strand:+ start:3368 stop:3700 length:333 start_codon:yes stop_codon:yes gene_type:complete